jgi:hypothetical protein
MNNMDQFVIPKKGNCTRSIVYRWWWDGATVQGISHAQFVEFVIQILKKAAKLASEAEARRWEAWATLWKPERWPTVSSPWTAGTGLSWSGEKAATFLQTSQA